MTPIGALPLAPGGAAEREALHSMLAAARARGIGARLHGHPGGARAGRHDALHAAAGALGAVAGAVTPWAVVWLGAWMISAAMRLTGRPALGDLWPRHPSWTLLLRRPSPATRAVYFVALDAGRPVWILRMVTFALLAASVAASVQPGPALWMLAGAQAIFALVALAWGTHRAVEDAPAARAAAALLAFAASVPEDSGVALLVCGSAAVDGAGVRAALDWYGAPRGCRAVWVTGVVGGREGPVAPAAELRRRSLAERTLLRAPGLEALLLAGYAVERLGGAPGAGPTQRMEAIVEEMARGLPDAAASSRPQDLGAPARPIEREAPDRARTERRGVAS